MTIVIRGFAAVAFGLAVGVLSVGAGPACTPAQVKAGEELARASATFVSKADPILLKIYEEELDNCLAQKTPEQKGACVNSVRDKWAPIKEGLRDIRSLWCSFEPEKCTKLDGGADGSR